MLPTRRALLGSLFFPSSNWSFGTSTWLLILLSLWIGAPGGHAQQQVLHSHVRAEVVDHRAAMVGQMAADQQIYASIVLPLRNQAALTSLLGRLYDPASPDYRKFLSVAQFTEQFGPTVDDFQAVVAFAQANGLEVTDLPANRMVVPIRGNIANINAALHVRMNVYQHPTEKRTFFSPDREPSLDLKVPVAHISGLDDFSLPQPMLRRANEVSDVQKAATVLGSGPGGSYLGSDMRAAYYGGTALTGNGQVVGILEFGGYAQSDVDLTFSNAGQSYNVPINNVLLDGATGGPVGDDAEQVLDIVQAIGMAPGLSQVRVYVGGRGPDDAVILNSMASENIAKQISCSWAWRPADPAAADVFFQEMAAQGQSFFTASGDSGAFYAPVSPFFYPADDQYVTAVGGTHLTTNSAGGGWVSETVWNSGGAGSGGGISPDNISIPSWQAGLSNSANGGSTTLRNVPDVAMEGDFDNYACANGHCNGNWAGTSFAAPRWAGYMALVNQQAVEAGNAPSGGLGFINPSLYRLAQDPATSGDFHDVTIGNNLTANQPLWFSATAGYDLTTGWGSANGQHLIDDLAGPQVPGFWLGSSQSTILLKPGSSATSTITITNAGGFSGSVNFAVTSALPSGVTASFSPNPTTGSTVLTLTADPATSVGNQAITITGTSGTVTASIDVTVSVHLPTFTLRALPNGVGINQAASGTSKIVVQPLYGFTDVVNFSASGLPSGVTAAFAPASATDSTTLTLTTSSSATPGTYTVTVTGTSGNITTTTTLSLTVYGPSFTLSSGGTVNVGLGASGNTYVYVYGQYGFTGSVNLTLAGLPAGVTAFITPNPTTGNSSITFSAANTTAVGQYVVTVTGTSGSLSASTTINLGIYAPTFTLSGAGSANVGQGGSTTSYLYVNPQYGFTGSVNLSVAGLPSGVTATWSPNPTTGYSTLTLAAASTAATGQYNLTITGTYGTQTATTSLTLGVFVPSFTLSTAYSATVGQGTSTTSYVYVNPQYGFTGSVNLSASGLPAGVTATFSPNPSTGYSVLTLQASSAAATGQYTVTITGTSGTQTASAPLTVGVYVPTFTLASYNGVTVGQGSSATGYVYVTPQYGFTGSVALSVAGLPAGVTASFSPNPTTGMATMTLNATSTATLGQYTLTLTGTSGTQTATTNITLGVYVPAFSIYSGGGLALGTGASASTYVNITPQYGFTGNVTLSALNLPNGVTASFSPNPTKNNSTITLYATSAAATGQYTFTIMGTSGTVTATTTMSVTVSVPTFTLSGPYSLTIGQGSSANSYVYVNGQYGFAGSVNLSISGLPSGVTATFSPSSTTGSSTILFNVAANAPAGTSTVTLTGTSGSQTVSTTFQLSIVAPSFTLYNTFYTPSMDQGTSASGYIFISPQYGFNGTVTLSATGQPSGVSIVFAPPSQTGGTLMTVTAGSSATPGAYTVTINGVSGTATASTSFALTINAPALAITASPSSLTLYQGSTQRSTLSHVFQNGYVAGVTYTASGLPSGVTASFFYATFGGTATLQLTASKSAPPSTSNVVITGTSGSIVSSIVIPVTINAGNAATTTSLSLTSGSQSVSSVAAGSLVTATATVLSGSTTVTTGQVNFCDAAVTHCDVTNSVGIAQLTKNGTAILQFIPGAGSHSYKAVFAGTYAATGSTSSPTTLAVTAAQPTQTTITQSGSPGNYTLTATVTGKGAAAPTGNLSFIDTSNGNVSTGSAPLIPGTQTFSLSAAPVSVNNLSAFTISTGDFNGDGLSDLVISNTDGTIKVLLAKGDGTFQTSATVVGGGSYIAVGDFNHDGHLDFATVLGTQGTLAVYLGNGDGTFTAAPQSQGAYGGETITVGDYNGDGLLDLALTNHGGGVFSILLGNGDGTFTPLNGYTSTGGTPQGLAQGDFNGDGILDLAVANDTGNSVQIFLGNGDATFNLANTYAVGSRPLSIAVTDFNADGKQDIAVANAVGNSVTILLGNGDGTFTVGTSPATDTYPATLAVADLNGDGKMDIVTANITFGTVSTLLGNGDGTFASAVNTPNGRNQYALVVGDWNGDGIPDFATSDIGTSTITAFITQRSQTANATATGISPVGTGQHAIDASYPGDVSYAASISATTLLTASPGAVVPDVLLSLSPGSVTTTQTLMVMITVSGIANQTPTGSVTLASGSYSSGSVNLSGGSALITVPAGALAAGADVLTASYTPDAASSSIYKQARGTAPISVSKAVPTVLLSVSPASITTSQPVTVTISVDGGQGAPVASGVVTLASAGYTSPAVALGGGSAMITVPAGTLPIGTDALQAAFTPDTASDPIYTSASGSSSVVVGKTTPVVAWGTPAGITYGTALSAAQLNATAGVAGTFSYSPAAGTVLGAGNQTLSVTFTPTDTTNYTTATATVTLTVSKATPVLSWTAPAAISYGTALSGTQLNASAPVAGTFAYTPASGTVLPAGAQTLSVTFTPTDTTDYLASSATVSLTVNPGAVSITWATPAPITYGTALGVAQLDATASVAGTFVYSPAAGTVLAAGSQTLSVTFTPTDTVNFGPVTASVSVQVNQATPAISWATPASITYGTALSSTQLNASSSIPGTFSYTPALGTVLGAGAQMLSVSFTPTDAIDYQSASATVLLTVNKATPIVTWPTPAAISYGAALSAAQLNATASVPGTFVYTPSPGAVLPVGVQTLSATFTPADSADYLAATSTVSLTVSPAAASVTWPAPASITYGAALGNSQLNATASVPGTFAYSPAAGTVLGAGTQTLSVTFAPTDSVTYRGITSTTAITVAKAPLSLTAANVTRTYGIANPTLTGTVSGVVNADTLTETFTTSGTIASAVGIYAITPSVTGANAANYAVSATNGTLTITPAGTGTSLTLSNSNLTFNATVISATSGTPTGSVGFYAGQTLLGTGTLANGAASYTVSAFPAGNVSLTAQYSGDGNFIPSTTASLPELAMTAATTSLTVAQTGTVSDVLTASVAPGYSGTVQFSCTGLPVNAACVFSPSSIAFGGTTASATTTLTIHTGGSASLALPPVPFSHPDGISWATALYLPGLLALGLASRRRKLTAAMSATGLMLLLCLGAMSLVGCGGASGSSITPPSSPPTPSGVYQVQVVASGPSGLTQTTSLSVTVH